MAISLACVKNIPYSRYLTKNPFKKHIDFETRGTGSAKMLTDFRVLGSLGIPMLPCVLEISMPDNLVAMTGFSRKNLRKFDIQSQNEEGRKDDDAYYATDGSL